MNALQIIAEEGAGLLMRDEEQREQVKLNALRRYMH